MPIDFAVGKLKFSALTSEYEVLSDSKVRFQGTGKFNGESGYSFTLTVIDGQAPGGGGVDKFRIRIWNKSTGTVVFDTQANDGNDAEPQQK